MNREALLEGSRSIQPILPHLHSSQKGTQVTYLCGVNGWADRKGGPAGHKERPRRCEDRGAAREGVLGAGRGSPESQDRGEGAASLGAGARGSASSGQEDAEGRGATTTPKRGRALAGEARGKKGF